LDDFVTDPGFLLAAGQPQLVTALGAVSSPAAIAAARAYDRATPHLRAAAAPDRGAYLQLAARCMGADELATAIDDQRLAGPWSARWVSWRHERTYRSLAGGPASVNGLKLVDADEPVLVVWDGTAVWVWSAASERWLAHRELPNGIGPVATGVAD